MTKQLGIAGSRKTSSLICAVMLSLVSTVLCSATPAFAQKLREQAKSLAFVPEDAAMYGALLNNQVTFDAVAGSNAWAKFAAMESVAPLLASAQEQWEALNSSPALKGPAQMLLQGLSDEVFYYVDPQYVEFMTIYQEASNQSTFAPIIAAMQGGGPDDTTQLIKTLDVFNDYADKLQMFDMVIGLRVKDPDAAKGLIPLAEQAIAAQLEEQPLFKERLKREKVGDVDVLTLKLDGSMVPWDELSLDEVTGEPGKYDSLIAKLKTLTIAISLCVKGEYLLLSVGDTNEHIATLGAGKGLTTRSELAKLRAVDGKQLASLEYASPKAMQMAADQTIAPLLSLLAVVPQMLPTSTDDMLRRRLDDDLQELSKDLRGTVPKAGVWLSATTFSPQGFDTLSWNWTINPLYDGTKPLTLLNHVGGDPVAYFVTRGKQSPQNYERLVKWLTKFDGYVAAVFENQGGEEDAAQYKKFRADIEPLLARLDKATRELMYPALADGQAALVLDAKLTSTQWFAAIPESSAPLPMPELGVVWGVSDAEKLKQASAEYFAVVSEVLPKLHAAAPDKFPDYKLPPPEQREFGDAKIYYYMLPKDWGVDKRVAPNAGLTENTAAAALTPLHTKRLLERTELVAVGPVAQRKDQPLVMAAGLNFAALVDAGLPWVEFAMTSGAAGELPIQEPPGEIEGGISPAVIAEIRQGAEILKCFRGYSSVTFREGSVEVSEGQWRFEDLK